MEIDRPIDGLLSQRDWFEHLLRPELPTAYRLAGYLLGDASAAEDATQDAMLRAWRAFAGLRDDGQFGPWFQRIVANVCRDHRRRRRLITFVPFDPAAAEPEADDPFRSSLDRVVIGRAVRQLSWEHREVVVLRYLLDLSNEDIAFRLGIPSGTVKSRMHYAFLELRRILEREGEGTR